MMHRAVICLGSNVADRQQRIERITQRLAAQFEVVDESPAMLSADITGRGEPYLNKAIVCDTALTLSQMNVLVSSLESAEGRTAESKAKSVMPIDIDIIKWDGEIVSPDDFARPYFKKLYQSLKAE